MTFEHYNKLLDKISVKSCSIRADDVVSSIRIRDRQKREHFIKSGMLSTKYCGDGIINVYVTIKGNTEYVNSCKRANITAVLDACCGVLRCYEN